MISISFVEYCEICTQQFSFEFTLRVPVSWHDAWLAQASRDKFAPPLSRTYAAHCVHCWQAMIWVRPGIIEVLQVLGAIVLFGIITCIKKSKQSIIFVEDSEVLHKIPRIYFHFWNPGLLFWCTASVGDNGWVLRRCCRGHTLWRTHRS